MRRLVAPVLAVVVLIAAAVAILTYLGGEASPASLVLSEVDGRVVITSRDGRTAEAAAGATLAESDRVATDEASRAVLAVGDTTRIDLGPASAVQVRDIDAEGVRIELEGGALTATVRPGSGALTVGNQGRQIVATDADFAVGVGKDGTLFAEASRGQLLASGIPGATAIAEGARLTVTTTGEASVSPIPSELLLSVQWPAETRTRAGTTRVSGRTEPGARVIVGHGEGAVEVVADASGAFVADVPLVEGTNRIEVRAVSVLGTAADVEQVVQRDTRGPSFQGQVGAPVTSDGRPP